MTGCAPVIRALVGRPDPDGSSPRAPTGAEPAICEARRERDPSRTTPNGAMPQCPRQSRPEGSTLDRARLGCTPGRRHRGAVPHSVPGEWPGGAPLPICVALRTPRPSPKEPGRISSSARELTAHASPPSPVHQGRRQVHALGDLDCWPLGRRRRRPQGHALPGPSARADIVHRMPRISRLRLSAAARERARANSGRLSGPGTSLRDPRHRGASASHPADGRQKGAR